MSIFELSLQEQELTNNLSQIIQAEIIANQGQISFSRYMELALYHPQYGYYNNAKEKFGAKGDFITAPMIGELFANCVAKQIRELITNKVKPEILEFGAGLGDLANVLLSKLADHIDKYYILELSGELISIQKHKLKAAHPKFYDKIIWLQELPAEFAGIVLANEVLDAQPCKVVKYNRTKLSELKVGYANDRFNFIETLLDANLVDSDIIADLPYSDYVTEIHPGNAAFMQSLAKIITSGVALFFDYGYGCNEYYAPWRNRGTLRGFFRHHQLDDVLIYPGLIDITSSVNFSLIYESATINNALELIGYTTLANFLINCGLLEDSLANYPDELTKFKLNNAINYLTSPNEMGEAFKVMALSKNIDFADYMGFMSQDRSYTLS